MKVETIKGFECPECAEFVSKVELNGVQESERFDCPQCGGKEALKDVPETARYECGECGESYEDRDEAKECCKD